MSKTLTGLLITILGLLASQLQIDVTQDQISELIMTIVKIGSDILVVYGIIHTWYGRYRHGDITWYGKKLK